MARLFLLITLLGILASGGASYLVVRQRNQSRMLATVAGNQVKQKDLELLKNQAELASAKANLVQTAAQLNEARARVTALEGDLLLTKDQATQLEKKLREAEEKLSHGAGDTDASVQDRVQQLEKENATLQQNLEAARSEVARLRAMMERSKTMALPHAVKGKVLSVNRTWNFVILDIGEKDGIVENAELSVYRNKKYVGRVKIVSTEARSAVADILTDNTKETIQPGDEVSGGASE
jgi:TolA-binding protein